MKLTNKQKSWLTKNNLTFPIICKSCPLPVKWNAAMGKFGTFCSCKCANSDLDRKIQTKQTNLERYGVDNPRKSPIIKNKIKQTNLERYGVEHSCMNASVRDKQKQTMLQRYGVEYFSQSAVIKEKIKQTNLTRYGTECGLSSLEIRNKIKQTCLIKYGVDNPRKSKDIQEKIKNTNLERYGVSRKVQSHMINILNFIEDYNWLFDEYINQNKTAAQIAAELGTSNNTICRYLHNHEITIRYSYRYSCICISWLEQIMHNQNIYIQHALNKGEYNIPNTKYRADGYCEKTNTVYEFHGDVFHGNPIIFKPHEICHPFSDLTAGELYQHTIERENIIRSLGYNLVVIWENEFISSNAYHVE